MRQPRPEVQSGRMPRPAEHPHLTGNYAPVPDETSINGLPVDGEIPAALHGRYLQIGPNPIGNPARPYVWAEADAMVHAITIRPGGHRPIAIGG